MKEEVARKILDLPGADSVYIHNIHGEVHYSVVFDQDQNDLSDQIASAQLEAYGLYPDFYFEVMYFIKENFNPDTIPNFDQCIIKQKEA
ncbi:MAG: hypothetical protein ACQEXV_22395 [Bacillota bacterium]